MNLLDDGIDQYQGINLGCNRYQSLIDNRPAEAHPSDRLGATSPINEEQKSEGSRKEQQ